MPYLVKNVARLNRTRHLRKKNKPATVTRVVKVGKRKIRPGKSVMVSEAVFKKYEDSLELQTHWGLCEVFEYPARKKLFTDSASSQPPASTENLPEQSQEPVADVSDESKAVEPAEVESAEAKPAEVEQEVPSDKEPKDEAEPEDASAEPEDETPEATETPEAEAGAEVEEPASEETASEETSYTKSQLMSMKKKELSDLYESLGGELDGKMTRLMLAEAILEIQG